MTISNRDYEKFKSSTKTMCLNFVGKESNFFFDLCSSLMQKHYNKQITELEKDFFFAFIKGTNDNHKDNNHLSQFNGARSKSK
jgi:hypothetical protein